MDYASHAAASKVVMRAGRHFALFTVNVDVHDCDLLAGVIRPSWDVEEGSNPSFKHGHCFYNAFDGSLHGGRIPGEWEGMQGADKVGDVIGLLLDLDQGCMTVYKNDVRLGVMMMGLSGEYSWAVSLFQQSDIVAEYSARIGTAEIAGIHIWG